MDATYPLHTPPRRQVDRTALGRMLFGLHWLRGPHSAVYRRWRSADWIGSALELVEGEEALGDSGQQAVSPLEGEEALGDDGQVAG